MAVSKDGVVRRRDRRVDRVFHRDRSKFVRVVAMDGVTAVWQLKFWFPLAMDQVTDNYAQVP